MSVARWAIALALLCWGMTANAQIANAVDHFYELRGHRAAWNRETLTELVDQLAQLSSDGLDPEHYGIASLQQALAANDGAIAPEIDSLATRACLLALLHLYRGAIDPTTLHPRWNLEPRVFDREAGLQTVSDALDRGQIAKLFDRARPAHPVYAHLRSALKSLVEIERSGGWPLIADGPTLEPGFADARVPVLRRRLKVAGYLGDNDAGTAYDDTVEQAVRRFQEEQYLEIDGKVGPATRRALNVSVRSRIDQLRVNLERARWVLPRIAGDFVMVDVAGYKVRYYRDGRSVWMSRVQVGRNVRRTPIFAARITDITLNPTWTVPPTILREDILPKLRESADFLAQNHIRVIDGHGDEIDPQQVDWNELRGLVLRQDPGPDNSVGRIRINFPNPYNVYLHETPHTELFGKSQRAFSSGCIRVERPFELAELLLADPERWSQEKIEEAVASGETRDVSLPHPVPILVMYWTVDLHDTRVAFKPDIYRLDARTLDALNRQPLTVSTAEPTSRPSLRSASARLASRSG